MSDSKGESCVVASVIMIAIAPVVFERCSLFVFRYGLVCAPKPQSER